MKLIKREQYLNKLINVVGTPDIKVITGVRRCGKSKLLESFKTYLKKEILDCNIIQINFNLPEENHKRAIQTFYSHDPLAKTTKLASFKMCWIDFSSLEEGTEIKRHADAYTYMGTLGESYSIMNRFLPPSYRMFQPPTTLYDSMIYVSNASPTKIIE